MNAAWCPDESHHLMRQSGQSTFLFSDLCACSQASQVAEVQNCASQLPAWGWPPGWDLGYLGLTLISVCSIIWISGFPFPHHCLLSSTFVCRKPEHWAAKSLPFVGLGTMGRLPFEEPGVPTLGFVSPWPCCGRLEPCSCVGYLCWTWQLYAEGAFGIWGQAGGEGLQKEGWGCSASPATQPHVPAQGAAVGCTAQLGAGRVVPGAFLHLWSDLGHSLLHFELFPLCIPLSLESKHIQINE